MKYKDFFSHLEESPDRLTVKKNSGPSDVFYWAMNEATPFIYDHENEILYVGFPKETHYRLDRNIAHFIYSKSDTVPNNIKVFSSIKSIPDLKVKVLNSNFKMDVDDRDEQLDNGDILGRYWSYEKIVSFWNSKEEVKDHPKFFELFKVAYGVDINEIRCNFIDTEDVVDYIDSDQKNTMSKDEIDKLIQAQHVDPEAKNKLKRMGLYGSLKMKEKKPEWQNDFI